MFTGIIKDVGEIRSVREKGANITIIMKSVLAPLLKVDESVAHNGICLTVEEADSATYQVTAVEETLKKTNARFYKPGDLINLERAMQLGDRLDGHLVQGHVDGTGVCVAKNVRDGSVEFTFRFEGAFAPLVIEKGSICLNGVSLTAFGVTGDQFTVAIIPHTFSHTNFSALAENDVVNIEFDLLGKYVQRMLQFPAAR